MKKNLLTLLAVGFFTNLLLAESTFSKKADLFMPKNSGSIYEMGSKGLIIVEGKRGLKPGEKLTPRIVLFKGKSLNSSGLEPKSIASNAPSSTYEIDVLKFEF